MSRTPLPTSPALKIAAPAASPIVAEHATASASETRRVRLSRVSPSDAKGLLSAAFAPYVQEEASEHQTPGDRGRIAIVTAPQPWQTGLSRTSRESTVTADRCCWIRMIAIEPSALQTLPLQWNGPERQVSGLSGLTAQTLMTLGSAPDQAATAVLRKELDLLRRRARRRRS